MKADFSPGSAPLSPAQQRLWFLAQLKPSSPVYNVYRAWRLSGGLNVDALQSSIDTIVTRHGVLRSIFRVVDGQPIQVAAAALSIPLPVVDLQQCSAAEQQAKSSRIAMREAAQPFDLVQGPLFRVTLLRLAEKESILLITSHHIVMDGWSMGVFNRELAALYGASVVNRSSPLPDLPIQYCDYALWQRERSQRDMLGSQLRYWKRQLAGLAVLALPTDRLRPPVRSYNGARETLQLSAETATQLKALSQREGATLFMTLLAAVNVLFHRYTGQNDIVVGSPVANRTTPELEPMIGLVVNTLILRTDMSGNPTFREVIARVREVCLGAYAHQDLPFEKLVEELHPARDTSRNPLFQVAFTLHNTPDQAPTLTGIRTTPFATGSVSPFDRGNDTAKFDLTVSMIETDGVIKGLLEYSTDLFDRTTIQRMAGHFRALLHSIAADPAQQLADFTM
jgi:hypothetical protein